MGLSAIDRLPFFGAHPVPPLQDAPVYAGDDHIDTQYEKQE